MSISNRVPLACVPSLVGVALLVPMLGFAATIHVPGNQPTIQAGINAAAAGDTVLVACGTYLEHAISMRSGVTLRSETSVADCVIVDGQSLDEVFTCNNVNNSTMIGLTIRGGGRPSFPLSSGGHGIRAFSSTLSLINCRIYDNHAKNTHGGGVRCDESSLTATSCIFESNTVRDTGPDGGYVESASGGGIYCAFSNLVLSQCVLNGNASMDHYRDQFNGSSFGGGLFAVSCAVAIDRSVFSHNNVSGAHDGKGGGLYCSNSSLALTNSSVYANRTGESSPDASGMYAFSTTFIRVEGCTFYGNTTDGVPPTAALVFEGPTVPRLLNTIIAFNDNSEAINSAFGFMSVTCCDIFGNDGGDWVGELAPYAGINGNTSLDPLFCDAANDDLTLNSASPCAPGNSGACGLIGALPVGCGVMAVGGGDLTSTAPPLLLQNQPNPFNHSTTLRFELPRAEEVTLRIHEVSGRIIRTLYDQVQLSPGQHFVEWDGRNERGNRVSSGVYFYHLDVGSKTLVQKMTLKR